MYLAASPSRKHMRVKVPHNPLTSALPPQTCVKKTCNYSKVSAVTWKHTSRKHLYVVQIANWWATTQLSIILTSRMIWPGGLCRLCLQGVQHLQLCEQLTKTSSSKRPASEYIITIVLLLIIRYQYQFNTTRSLYNINAMGVTSLVCKAHQWQHSSNIMVTEYIQ